MRISLKASSKLMALPALAIISALVSAGAASANPYVFNSSYIGAGYSAGVTSGGATSGPTAGNDAAVDGGNIQGRVAIPGIPVSVRGAVLFTESNSAIIPSVTYDLPIASNVNIYAGPGYSFVQKQGQRTPIGNRDAFVLMAGAEAGITPRIVGYGDVKWGIDAYKNSPADSLSFQAGLGYRF
jgi:hypothetical protein